MRARSAFFAGAGSVAILAIGWQAGVGTLVSSLPTSAPAASGTAASAGTATSANTATNTATTTAGNTAGTGSTGTTSNTSTTPNAAGTAADGTYNGQTVSTRFGTVQVNAVISGGLITDVVAIKLTDQGRQSVNISKQAAPMIRQEVLTAQSARVSNIGGATYTTRGYLQSLQSALDAAGYTG